MVKLAGIEPASSGHSRRSATELQPRPSFGGTRTRRAHRASRDLTSPDTGPSEGGRASRGKARRNKDGGACCDDLNLARARKRRANGASQETNNRNGRQ